MWLRRSGIPVAERRPAIVVTLAATFVFTLVVCRWRPWNLFARGGFTSDFYDAQAHAFLNGRLAVPADVAGIEGFLVDGRTYLYYGPLLAVARLPTALFGSVFDGRLTRLSMIVGFVALCTVTFHLARRIARVIGADPGAPWRPALLVAAVACSPALALAGQATVYHETELWAFVLMLATFVKLVDVLLEPSVRAGALAAGCAVATVLTRVSVGYGAVVAVGLVAIWIWRRDRSLSRAPALTMVGIAGAGVLASVGLNLAKFHTLFDLPADRQVLTLLDPDRAEWFAGNGNSFFGVHFLPTTVVHYLRPDAFALERLVPFVRFGPRAHEFGSSPLESNTPSSSLTAAATLLVVLGAIGAVTLIRRRCWSVLPLVGGCAVAAIPTLAIGFIANRYLVDLLPLVVVLGAVACATFTTTRRTLGLVAVGVLVAWGVWINVALATWLDNIERPGFTALRYDVDDALFGGSPPGLTALDPAAPVPRDGVVGVDGPCDGLYIASQGTWVALELAAGVRRIDAIVRPADGTGVVVGSDTESIEIVADDDAGTVQLRYAPTTGDAVEGAVLAWDGDDLKVTIISDPTAGGLGRGLHATVDGADALSDFRAPDLSTMIAGADVSVDAPTDGGVPICASLAGRVD